MLKLTNTLTGQKEEFHPLQANKVTLYVCGITPYDYAHVGHARVYVVFDTLYRLLDLLGYNVTYCRNFTDIDDKLIARACKEHNNPTAYHTIASRFIDSFHQNMKTLNCLAPTFEPRVTEHIDSIIAFISGLIAAGKAYQVDGDVYYHIAQFPGYGKLSKQKLDDLRAGARVDVNDKKKDPLDFALWKGETVEPYWQSPWGTGRPGWHIECSTLANDYLGQQIDIHGGGMDLIFPHHENEIAQTEGLTQLPFARYWVHNAFVRINQEKMSKSLGNFFTINDLLQVFDPMILRFLIVNHHYRAPLDFSFQDTQSLEKSYQRLAKHFDALQIKQPATKQEMLASPIVQEMLTYLCDDLNTPGMLGVVFEQLKTLAHDQQQARAVKSFLQSILGLELKPLPEKQVEITPEMQQLLDAREAARKAKDWAKADALRDQLKQLGFDVQDKKS